MLGRRFLWVVAIFIPFLGWGQPPDRFQTLLQSAPGYVPVEQATLRMSQFLTGLQAKRAKFKSDELFLRYAFRESHKSFFHNYKSYSQFSDVFDSGNYDCLSATSFFSIVLDAFAFDYKIIETNYHIFLIVESDQKMILMETTDQSSGVISDKRLVRERLNQYRENNLVASSTSDKYYYQYDLDLYQEILPNQLTGLLFFNQAVTAFNNNDLAGCAGTLKKAIRIYNSPRMAEFAVILVNKVAESEIAEEEKRKLIRPFASLIKERASFVAAR